MKEKLKKFIIAEVIYHEDPASFGDDDDLLEAGLDSMGIMRLIMFAEKEFGVILPDTEIEPDISTQMQAKRLCICGNIHRKLRKSDRQNWHPSFWGNVG